MRKAILATLIAVPLMLVLGACERSADVASKNLSKAADEFEVQRRIVFVNGITDKYLLIIEGRCSLGNFDSNRSLSVTCKTGDGEYVKHFLGLSDNVTYVVEQLASLDVSVFHNRIQFKPQSVIPDIDFQFDGDDLTTNRN